MCPISKKQISIPTRGTNCTHQDSFDLINYLRLNKKPGEERWICPVCKSKIYWNELVLDSTQLLEVKFLGFELSDSCSGYCEKGLMSMTKLLKLSHKFDDDLIEQILIVLEETELQKG